MNDTPEHTQELSAAARRLVRLRIWFSEHIQINELQATLAWAAIIGLLGAWSSIFFKEATDWLHTLLTGFEESIVLSFEHMPVWRRIAVPVIGGLLAGITLYFGNRLKGKGNSTDYMEAVVVGDGNLSVRASLVKCISAWFSGSSGASIGREGPLVLLSSLAASIAGRWLHFPLARKRQIVACGAAAGIASAYNAPVAGAFFVAEIVLGSVAMEAFGPLVVSSVVATLVTHAHYGPQPLYPANFAFQNNYELIPYLLLGLLAGLMAPVFLGFLKQSEQAFGKLKLPAWCRLALGGLLVGLLAVYRPEVTGNGRSLVQSILHNDFTWQFVAAVFVCKLLATGATFGSGAVGGVFTPTLFTGAAIGYLFGATMAWFLPDWNLVPAAFGLVGMGAFLAASTGAPVMAIIMIFELTLSYQFLIPVMLASVIGYYVCRSLTQQSLYTEALQRKGANAVAQHLAALKIGDLMKEDAGCLPATATFGEIARSFLQNRHDFLHIVDDGRFLGAVSLHDIKPYLDQPELESLIIARDVMRDDFPSLKEGQTMGEALNVFGDSEAERLPVIDSKGTLLGAVTRTDVLLFLAGRPRKAT